MISTTSTRDTSAAPPWRDEIVAGLSATTAMLPLVIMFAFLAFGSVGEKAAQIGLTASVVSVVIGGIVMAVAGRSALPTASPTAPTSLILGGFVAQLVQDPALNPDLPDGAHALIAVTGATVLISGVLLVLLGALRLGNLARFAPQPVLAGFMNGIAILIFVSQIGPTLGLSPGTFQRENIGAALAQAHWPSIAAAVGTTAFVFVVAWRFKRVPAALLGLVVALALVELLNVVLPQGVPLPRIGELSIGLPRLDTLRPLMLESALPLLQQHGLAMFVTAVVLALIGALQSVLSIASMDQLLNARTDLNRELRALGFTNVVSGLFGGLPLAYLRLFAIGCYGGGGRSYRSVIATSVMLAVVFSAGLPLVTRLPQAVVAGILIVASWTLVDRWTRDLVLQWWWGDRTRELLSSLAIVAIVCAVTLKWGFVAGVGAGSVVAVLVFIRALNRSLVRRRYLAADIPSRRVYPPELEAYLAHARRRIEVIELEGALFFGNADRLADEADRTAQDIRYLVVDFRRVTTIDASGAVGLALLDERLQKRGKRLMLAGVTRDNRHGRAILAQGVFRAADAWHGFMDADHAVEASEIGMLDAAGHRLAHLAIPLHACQVFEGLDETQRQRVVARLVRRELAAGTPLFEEGDPGNALFVLTEGSITIVDRARVQRYLCFSPGMCFGETALLDRRGRSAAAVADVASVVFELPGAALEELQRTDPALAALFYRNLAKHLSERLRSAANAWRQAAG